MHAQRVVGLRRRCFGQGGGCICGGGYCSGYGWERSKHCADLPAHAGGQNCFGEVAGPFLAFFKDFSNYNDFHLAFKKQMGLHKVFYVLDPASCALTSLDAVDGALLEEVVRASGSLSAATVGSSFGLSLRVDSDSLLAPPPVLERTLSEPLFADSLMYCAPPEPSSVLGRSLSEYY